MGTAKGSRVPPAQPSREPHGDVIGSYFCFSVRAHQWKCVRMRSGLALPQGMGRTPRALSWSLGGAPCVCSTDHQLTEAAHGPLPENVTQLAVAEKGAPGVLADAMEADVGVQVTLVHVCGVTGEATGEGVVQQHACVPCHMGPLHPGSFCPSSRIGSCPDSTTGHSSPIPPLGCYENSVNIL